MLQGALLATALVVATRDASAQETPAEPQAPAVIVLPPAPAERALAPAAVENTPPIGGRGRVVVDLAGLGGPSGAIAFGALGGFAGPFYFSSIEGDVALGFAPSADVFVGERLSLGGRVSVSSTKIGPFDAVSYGAAPRIGYALPISSSFGFWPRIGIGGDFTNDLGRSYFVDADAGFVVRVSKHLLMDLGPVVTARRRELFLGGQDITSVDARARVALRLDF